MLFQLTNSCDMMCPHCMDDCRPGNQHMSDETFEKALAFARQSNAHVVLLSGGEPSLHPHFLDWTERCASEFSIVSIISNGTWMGTKTENGVLDLMRRFPHLSLQVTSVRGIYRLHDETVRLFAKFKDKVRSLPNTVEIHTGEIGMMALGRAAASPDFLRQAEANTAGSTSCFATALISAQLPYRDAYRMMELRGKFCHPLVDWKGGLHWSESALCPTFASVYDPFDAICTAAHNWRPCGKCPDYQKLMRRAKEDPRYAAGCGILGLAGSPTATTVTQ